MYNGIIYKITCLENNSFLFGSTKNLRIRKNLYNHLLRKNKYGNAFLQRCFNKYGKDSLKFEIVQDNVPEDILLSVEDIWIGANCSKISDKKGGMNMRDAFSPKHSEETKKLMSKVRKGKLNTWNKGKPMSQKQKELLSKIKKAKNYKVSDEVKLKISLTTKGRKKSEEWKSKLCIPILQFSLNNEFIKEWKSAKEIGLNFNVDSTSFIQCCKHKQKTAYGFIWKYKDKTLQKTKYRIK